MEITQLSKLNQPQRNWALGINGAIRWFTDRVNKPFDKSPKIKLNERQRDYAERYTLVMYNLAHYTGGIIDEIMLINHYDQLATYEDCSSSIQAQLIKGMTKSFTRLLGIGKDDSWFEKRTATENQLKALLEESKNDVELQKAQLRIMFGLHLLGKNQLKALSIETSHKFQGVDSQKIDYSQLDLAEIYQYLGLKGLKAAFNYLQFLPEPPQHEGLAKMFNFMDKVSTVKILPQREVEYTFFKK